MWTIKTGVVRVLCKALVWETMSWAPVAQRCVGGREGASLHGGAVSQPDLRGSGEVVDRAEEMCLICRERRN